MRWECDVAGEKFQIQWPVYSRDFQEATYPYPYGGYDAVLEEVYSRSGQPGEGAKILDLAPGEGNLASHFWAEGCEVFALASGGSGSSIERLTGRLPGISVIQCVSATSPQAEVIESFEGDRVARLRSCIGECEPWGPFDVVVWSYDLREVCDGEGFVAIVEEVFKRCIAGKKGVMVVGCVSFEREEDRRVYEEEEGGGEGKKRALVFEEVKGALIQRRLRVQYAQLYPCAGLYKIKRR